jgi:hypothetical protein
MNFFCRLFGHTWVHATDNPRISWNTAKNLSELDLSAEETKPAFWLECRRCGERVENPTREQIKRITA